MVTISCPGLINILFVIATTTKYKLRSTHNNSQSWTWSHKALHQKLLVPSTEVVSHPKVDVNYERSNWLNNWVDQQLQSWQYAWEKIQTYKSISRTDFLQRSPGWSFSCIAFQSPVYNKWSHSSETQVELFWWNLVRYSLQQWWWSWRSRGWQKKMVDKISTQTFGQPRLIQART